MLRSKKSPAWLWSPISSMAQLLCYGPLQSPQISWSSRSRRRVGSGVTRVNHPEYALCCSIVVSLINLDGLKDPCHGTATPAIVSNARRISEWHQSSWVDTLFQGIDPIHVCGSFARCHLWLHFRISKRENGSVSRTTTHCTHFTDYQLRNAHHFTRSCCVVPRHLGPVGIVGCCREKEATEMQRRCGEKDQYRTTKRHQTTSTIGSDQSPRIILHPRSIRIVCLVGFRTPSSLRFAARVVDANDLQS